LASSSGGRHEISENILVILPILVTATTALAQSEKQMIINRNNNATMSGGVRALNPQPIPPGKFDSSNSSPQDRALNPQPIPPGKYHALNPQPIPPGIATNGSPKKKKNKYKKRKLD
jgi:hypothetical protein